MTDPKTTDPQNPIDLRADVPVSKEPKADDKNPRAKKSEPLLDVNGQPQHWLVKPTTIKLLWVGGIALLAFVTWLGTTVHPHATFGIEGTFGFYSWYGFVTCFAMVIFAKLLGFVISRKDTYYDK